MHLTCIWAGLKVFLYCVKMYIAVHILDLDVLK